MERIKGIETDGNYLYEDNGQLKIQRVTNENKDFLDILGEAAAGDKLISLNKACDWWIKELLYPSITQEEQQWCKNKINAFCKAMEERRRTMDYEQLYKDALERASKLRVQNPFDTVSQMMEHVFPELAESEDERIRGAIIEHLKDNNLTEWASWLEKQNKKIEPTFKVGDWVCNGGGNPCKVNDIFGNYYELCSTEGYQYSKPVSDIDKTFHLWTIEDAKSGDVLAAHECYVIFKEIDGLNIKCYCTYHYMNIPSFYVDTLQNKDAFHPATKEQCDLLFKKIKEEGYKWNAKNKILKKIESNSDWTENDRTILDGIIDEIEVNKNEAPSYDLPTYEKYLNWLKSLKKKIINE